MAPSDAITHNPGSHLKKLSIKNIYDKVCKENRQVPTSDILVWNNEDVHP